MVVAWQELDTVDSLAMEVPTKFLHWKSAIFEQIQISAVWAFFLYRVSAASPLLIAWGRQRCCHQKTLPKPLPRSGCLPESPSIFENMHALTSVQMYWCEFPKLFLSQQEFPWGSQRCCPQKTLPKLLPRSGCLPESPSIFKKEELSAEKKQLSDAEVQNSVLLL